MALDLLEAVGFGHVVVSTTDGLDSAPVPFLVDRSGSEVSTLRFHVARANPIWRSAPADVLVITPASDAYVSPSWYPSKAEHGQVVPTWNYEVVHVHGRLLAHDDPTWVEHVVRDLTEREEASMPAPWSVDDAPPEFVTKQLRAIVGLEVLVNRIEGKRKLSQNRSDTDRSGAAAGLRAHGDAGSARVAAAMHDLD